MTLTATGNRISFAGNGIVMAFAFPFVFFNNTDIAIINRVEATGVETLLTLNTDYTLVGAGLPSGFTANLTVAPPAGTTVTIVAIPAITQSLALIDNQDMPANAFNTSLDILATYARRAADVALRCLKLSEGFDPAFDLTLPTVLPANGQIVINAAGNGLAVTGGSGGGGGTSTTVTNGGDTDYDMMASDQFVRSGTPFTQARFYTLPPATIVGQTITVKHLRSQGFAMTVGGNGGDVIDGLGSVVLAAGMSISVECGAVGAWDVL